MRLAHRAPSRRCCCKFNSVFGSLALCRSSRSSCERECKACKRDLVLRLAFWDALLLLFLYTPKMPVRKTA